MVILNSNIFHNITVFCCLGDHSSLSIKTLKALLIPNFKMVLDDNLFKLGCSVKRQLPLEAVYSRAH